ncbi:MAG: hypothetical protein HC933_21720 [Pleurocapsa sp. SU_196_0]|nr:hypothetical protein [Pleurocapsa sp. SU_196_0]
MRIGFQQPQDGFVTNFADAHLDSSNALIDGSAGGHAVLIVGFIEAQTIRARGLVVPGGIPQNVTGYFVIKNSWGCSVGDGGFYYIPDTYVLRYFTRVSSLRFGPERSAAWQNLSSPYLQPIGGSSSIRAELRVPKALFLVAPPAGGSLADLQVQVNSSVSG